MHKDIENKYNSTNITYRPLRLGQVDFINCLPVNLPIDLEEVKINVDIFKGIPRELNAMILRGDIDIAPVSSLVYLENKDKLALLGNLCIASNGPADSVLLFSEFPVEELDGAKVALSTASATSNRLLQVIFREFLKLEAKCELPKSDEKYPAKLLIGDHALIEFSKNPTNTFIYDLGSLWKKYTDLPMVFGIWVVRKETLNKYEKESNFLLEQLNKAKDIGLSIMFEQVVKKAQEQILIPREFYIKYFQHLSYDLTNECLEGLNKFENHCFSLK